VWASEHLTCRLVRQESEPVPCSVRELETGYVTITTRYNDTSLSVSEDKCEARSKASRHLHFLGEDHDAMSASRRPQRARHHSSRDNQLTEQHWCVTQPAMCVAGRHMHLKYTLFRMCLLQTFVFILWEQKFHSYIHKHFLFVPKLIQINPFHAILHLYLGRCVLTFHYQNSVGISLLPPSSQMLVYI
jgi:hypothetical protein